MRNNKYIVYGIGIVGFIFLIRLVDVNDIRRIAESLDTRFLMLALVMSLTVQLIKPFRWASLLEMIEHKISMKDILRVYLIGVFWGAVTPARIGDFCRVVYIRKLLKEHAQTGKLISTIIMERLLELLLVIVVSVAGIVIFAMQPVFKVFFAGVLGVVLAVLFVGRHRHRFKDHLFWVLKKMDTLFPNLSLVDHAQGIWQGLSSAKDARMKKVLFYHVLSYVCFYSGIIFLMMSLNLMLSPLYVCVAISVAMVISTIPISIAGLGSRDAVLLMLFLPQGVTYDQVLFFSVSYLFIFIVFPAAIGSAVYFFQPALLRRGDIQEARRIQREQFGKERA